MPAWLRMLPCPVMARSGPVPCCCAALDGWFVVAQRRLDRWAAWVAGLVNEVSQYVGMHIQLCLYVLQGDCAVWYTCLLPNDRFGQLYLSLIAWRERWMEWCPVVLSCEDRSSPKTQNRSQL